MGVVPVMNARSRNTTAASASGPASRPASARGDVRDGGQADQAAGQRDQRKPDARRHHHRQDRGQRHDQPHADVAAGQQAAVAASIRAKTIREGDAWSCLAVDSCSGLGFVARSGLFRGGNSARNA